MTTAASEHFRAGRLAEAIEAQVAEVKSKPGDPSRRLFLFELLAFAGDLDRARRQVEALAYDTPELTAAVQNYKDCLAAEATRRRAFGEGLAPEFLQEPPAHVRLRLEAAGLLRTGDPARAAERLAEADATAPPTPGRLNGRAFTALRDCDDLLGPVLEVLARGRYYWVPLEQVAAVGMNAPQFPRDLIWAPARLQMLDGAEGEVFLPALYPGTHAHADPQIRLGRMTDWIPAGDGGPVQGVGLKTFLVDDDPLTLLDWRELILTPTEEETPSAPAEAG